MRNHKTIRDLAIALGFLVLWGNIVSLLLPADEYGSIIKIVDFASLLFAAVVLGTGLSSVIKKGKAGKKEESKKENTGND